MEDSVVEFNVENLNDVREEKNLFPVTKGLKVRVAKANPGGNKDKDIHSLKLELRVVDGIPDENGVPKYVNKPMFTGVMDLVYGADTSVKGRDSSKWWKGKQHLVGFKQFCQALGIDLSSIKINDEFFANLIGKELLVDVLHEAQTSVDPQTGEKVKTGEFREKLKNWRKVV